MSLSTLLLDNLNQVLTYHSHLINVDERDNILALRQQLETLKGLEEELAKHDLKNGFLKDLANQIRSIVHQAEDEVDTYIVQVAQQKSRSWISNAFHVISYPQKLWDVGKQIEELAREVRHTNLYDPALQYQPPFNLRRPKKSPRVEEERVVGFDVAAEEVRQLLTGGNEQFEAISIVGMLGVGKTTLARKVYNDPHVDYEYMIRSFVYVSKDYERREVFLNILGSLMQIPDEVNRMSEEELEKHLHDQLEGKQYLIVLDDVWEVEDWERLKHAFPKNKKRSRVLITTRNENVARNANPEIPSFKLDFLPFDESRELLRWKVFGDGYCPEQLQEYEARIAQKCDGLPLAIVLTASIILNYRDSVDWWKNVAEKDYLIGRDELNKVTELMYLYLPNHLKPCFLYLGVFPEDFEIPVWKLVRLWIAEGLIHHEDQDVNPEDMAERYLEELVRRNLVMVAQRRSNGKIKTCRVHSVLRDFCNSKAVEESFFQEITKNKLAFFLSKNPDLDQCRRLCIKDVNILDYVSATPSGKYVRSFLTSAREETTLEPKLFSSIPNTSKLLKVLEIQPLLFTGFPVDFCHLFLLKYLAISSNSSHIPSAMSNLLNLQTFIVNTTSFSLEIKADIWKMPQLRHLHTNASTILPCPDTKNNQNEALIGKNHVQTLSTISPESCRKEVFYQTPKIRKLGIRGRLAKLFELNGESSLFDNIGKLDLLENLKLLNEDPTSRLHSLPSEKSFPARLTKLTLMNTLLDWSVMSTLGKLDNLEVLKLKEHAFQGQLWRTEKGGFVRLKHLHIGRTDLLVWEASGDHFPELERLELHYCHQLQAVPNGLADIPTLQSIVLHCTNSQVASSARRLQVLKLEELARKGNKTNSFKLSVYPPEH